MKKDNKGKRDDSSTESKERIIDPPLQLPGGSSPPRDNADGIVVTTEYTLAHDDQKSTSGVSAQ